MNTLLERNRKINILEVGSGKGMHINYFAKHFRESNIGNIKWQPTDRNEDAFHVINQNILIYNHMDIVKEPMVLDLNDSLHMYDTKRTKYDMVFAINVFHCISFECWQRFIRHSFYNLLNFDNPNRLILLYGPFNVDNKFTSQSNEEFDAFMRETGGNKDYYLKDITAMNEYANEYSMELCESIPMPSNNFCFVFRTMDRDFNDFEG